MDNLRSSLLGDVDISSAEEQPKTTVKRGPSQIVTYSSRFVDKLSEITDDMNISGSLSIKYGAIGGSGRGSFINSDKFKESDLNFYISVKVINQTINIKDALKYQNLPSVNEKNFSDIYGDSFISGFLEGGEFNALVSMKVLNKERKTDIEAGAKVALSVGAADIEAEANVKVAKQNINNNTETTIQVSWSGGGNIKPMDEPWTIDTLRAAAARFPELVATTPQRTYAILTKYETLRSFLALKPEKLIPLYYENATMYTNSLLDTYMDYKNMYRKLSTEMFDVQSGSKRYMPMNETAADSTTLSRIDDERKFTPSYKGVDLAKRACMYQMMKIVKEVDEITKKPGLATDETRGEQFQSSLAFADRLPKVEAIKKEPVNPLTTEVIKADDAEKVYPSLYDGDNVAGLAADEQQKIKDLTAERPSLSENLRLGVLSGSDFGDLFCCVDFLKPEFSLIRVRVEITSGVVSALHMQYSNGLVTHLGSDATGDRTISLDIHPDQNEKVIACSIEVGRMATEKARVRVTALRLYTNRGPDLLGQADDWRPAVAGKALRGGVQFEDLVLTHFDPALEKGHLKGFWGRTKNVSKAHPTAGLYRLGPVWGNLSGGTSAATGLTAGGQIEDDAHEFPILPAGVWAVTDARPWDKPVPHTTSVVSYQSEFPEGPVPTFMLGLSYLDMAGAANPRAMSYVESVTGKDFSINIDSWADTTLYQAKLAWLGVPTNDPSKFQVGKFEARSASARDIKFSKAFKKAPTVVVWLTGLDEEKGRGLRINAYATDVTANGFKIHADCWNQSVLYWASLSWIAFSEDTGIISGSYRVDIGVDLNRKRDEGRAKFPAAKFSKPPRVITAFNHLDLNAFNTGANVRIGTEVDQVTTEGFRYQTWAWDESQIHYTTATWLALPSA
ncbi:hypothetical protein DBV05_g8943 [Lasiodiplodia theobromae]|uniref:H-type lectin domain-containing protein n=1 Tax=Lasiodiplodia theobromae TaxID=45133 RepID=A0A5N5D3Y9_9PEZI|nr:hypothetical protein DBV05_g8943 [Lasiodiplodia theobromae]